MKILLSKNKIVVEGGLNAITAGDSPSLPDGSQDKTRFFEITGDTSVTSDATEIEVTVEKVDAVTLNKSVNGIIEGVIVNDDKAYFYSYEESNPRFTLTPQAVYSITDQEFKEINSYNDDDFEEDDPFHPIILQEELGDLASYIF